MKTETLIEQIAEVRSLQTVNCLMLMTLLESLGCDAAAMIEAVGTMTSEIADDLESRMRQACGLAARTLPRDPLITALDDLNLMRSAPWSGSRTR